MKRTSKDAYGLLGDMALNSFSWNSDRQSRKPSGVHSISTKVTLATQMEALQKQLNQMNVSQHQMVSCAFCGGDHDSMDYQIGISSKQVNFMKKFQGSQNNFNRPIQNEFQNRGLNRFQIPQANPQNDPYALTYNLD